jgi:hypothetical protein
LSPEVGGTFSTRHAYYHQRGTYQDSILSRKQGPEGMTLSLFRCPFCSFRNIHEDVITHHIRYKQDSKHDVDVDKLDKKLYTVTKNESSYAYGKKEDLPLPSIKCLWCSYTDKIERDLEWHFIEIHRKKLNGITVPPEERRNDSEWTRDPFSWMYPDLEYRVYKALKLAKKMSVVGVVVPQ